MTAAIQAAGLGKRDRRGVQASRGMLCDTLTNFVRASFAILRRPKHESFWALEDGFNEGDALGLIRCNGEGKTTLLKDLPGNYILHPEPAAVGALLSQLPSLSKLHTVAGMRITIG